MIRAVSNAPVAFPVGAVCFRDPAPRLAMAVKATFDLRRERDGWRLELAAAQRALSPVELVPRKSLVDVTLSGRAFATDPSRRTTVELHVGETHVMLAAGREGALQALGPREATLTAGPPRSADEAALSAQWFIAEGAAQIAAEALRLDVDLRAGTEVRTVNLTPGGGPAMFRVPRETPYLIVSVWDGSSRPALRPVSLRCDALHLDATRGTVELTFRGDVGVAGLGPEPVFVVGLGNERETPSALDVEAAVRLGRAIDVTTRGAPPAAERRSLAGVTGTLPLGSRVEDLGLGAEDEATPHGDEDSTDGPPTRNPRATMPIYQGEESTREIVLPIPAEARRNATSEQDELTPIAPDDLLGLAPQPTQEIDVSGLHAGLEDEPTSDGVTNDALPESIEEVVAHRPAEGAAATAVAAAPSVQDIDDADVEDLEDAEDAGTEGGEEAENAEDEEVEPAPKSSPTQVLTMTAPEPALPFAPRGPRKGVTDERETTSVTAVPRTAKADPLPFARGASGTLPPPPPRAAEDPRATLAHIEPVAVPATPWDKAPSAEEPATSRAPAGTAEVRGPRETLPPPTLVADPETLPPPAARPGEPPTTSTQQIPAIRGGDTVPPPAPRQTEPPPARERQTLPPPAAQHAAKPGPFTFGLGGPPPIQMPQQAPVAAPAAPAAAEQSISLDAHAFANILLTSEVGRPLALVAYDLDELDWAEVTESWSHAIDREAEEGKSDKLRELLSALHEAALSE